MAAYFSAPLFALMCASYVLGGYQLSNFANGGGMASALYSFGAYLTANVMLILFLRSGGYGAMMVLSALAVLIGNVAVSAFIFDERYTPLQIGGVVLASVSILLVSGVGGDGGGS